MAISRSPEGMSLPISVSTVHDFLLNVIIKVHMYSAQDHPLTNLKEAAALGAMYNSMERNDAPRCLEGTRQSQLSEIMLWVLDDSPDAPPFMWLSGGAGAGKSTIAQTVAELSAKEGRLGASFFFQRGHLERSNVERLLPSIAFQLALSNKTIERHIIDIVANDPLIVKDKAMDRQFAELMLRPLNEVGAHTYPPSIVVLDGLDEASDHAVLRKLFAVLKDNLGIPNPPFRVFISSRPEFSIGAFFRSIPLLYRYIHLGPSEETNNDIRKYLLHGFSEIRTRHSDILPSSVSWPLNEDIDMLVAKSSGHFIYASTVLKFIDYERDHPRNSLNFILGRAPLRSGRQSAFAELDELYSAILSRVVAPEHKYLLSFLSVISSREVDICSAAEAVDIPLEDAQLMLRGLRSVVGSGGSPIMGFLHSSLGEFLRDSSRSGEFFLREDELRIERRHVNHVTHRYASSGLIRIAELTNNHM
jgi:hypothetical protein